MRRIDVIERLKATESAMRAIGVGSLFLFGSHARDDAGEQSDIDIFIDPEDTAKFGFDAFMESFERIQTSFPETEIGYGTRRGIAPHYRPLIEADAIRIF
jgi:uncharacterized protein